MHIRNYSIYALALLLLVGIAGCSSMSNTEKGAAVGAGAGAVIGGVIGKATGSTAKGAIIGAAVGGTAGAIIGAQMKEQAAELDEELENAEVTTVIDPETGEVAGINITMDSAILFGFDSAELSAQSRTDLRDLAASLQKYENTEALVVGHTDSRGTDDYNQRLSERRAQSVAAFLEVQGIPQYRLKTEGRGEREPIATNDTDAGRQLNRRVEIAIYASQEYIDSLNRQ